MLLHEYHAPVYLRNNNGRTALENTKDKNSRKMIKKQEHQIIQYDYKQVQDLSSKKYSGTHKLTRVLVVGHVQSGKSTLIESLKRDGLFSSLNQVSEATVPPHTSGIIPSEHYSKTIGRVLYYDFAGDPQYYSSHSAIMSNVMQSNIGTNICLILINFTKSIESIHDELGYWLTFISYHNKYLANKSKVLIIGSHTDLISDTETKKMQKSVSHFVHTYLSQSPKISYGVVKHILALNCCKPQSAKHVHGILIKLVSNTCLLYTSDAADE